MRILEIYQGFKAKITVNSHHPTTHKWDVPMCPRHLCSTLKVLVKGWAISWLPLPDSQPMMKSS
jgi:hypothetical protein